MLSALVDGDKVAQASFDFANAETWQGKVGEGLALGLIIAINVVPGGGEEAKGVETGLEKTVTSSIGKDAKLVKYAEDAGKSVQKGLDHLVDQLSKGNTNPGIGTKGLSNGISYARARDGARVFFRQAGEQIEILAKAYKANEANVINYLNKIYK